MFEQMVIGREVVCRYFLSAYFIHGIIILPDYFLI